MVETANSAGAEIGATAPVTAPVSREQIKRPAGPPPAVYLDETRDFSTVHGERTPGDPHALVCFVQNGLPFDAQKKLIRDHYTVIDNAKAKALIERMEARAAKLIEKQKAKEEGDEVEEDEEEDDGEGVVDLKAWAMGKKYRWQLISDALVLRLGKRITNKRDALENMIAEGIVQPGQLSKEHKLALQRL